MKNESSLKMKKGNQRRQALVLMPAAFMLAWVLWPISKILAVIGFTIFAAANILSYFLEH
ncbi:hypothetical protein [Streptococcus macacae]